MREAKLYNNNIILICYWYVWTNIILFIFLGARQVQDIYVRLIDSATKQVSTNVFISNL